MSHDGDVDDDDWTVTIQISIAQPNQEGQEMGQKLCNIGAKFSNGGKGGGSPTWEKVSDFIEHLFIVIIR